MDFGIVKEVQKIATTAKSMGEDFPGQSREYFHQEVIRLAVRLADLIIMEASDGSSEETDLLTCEIAAKLTEKVRISLLHQWTTKALLPQKKK